MLSFENTLLLIAMSKNGVERPSFQCNAFVVVYVLRKPYHSSREYISAAVFGYLRSMIAVTHYQGWQHYREARNNTYTDKRL